ncbi:MULTISPECIES: TetR family transcriptional regulator C-terminal domain-containing protein [unclassified Paraburkholderia]|uniref:TetR family transcriptional regulator C-terminal domain-containing protein n=1 Tax=unclassified Paraburkholderia TaxID=2615204 RepID=UPI002AAF4D2A|nr:MULTISPECIES: TetR family transcriptional regulator C-terminal domain-containing protein [unclassified Paraburkholderia]
MTKTTRPDKARQSRTEVMNTIRRAAISEFSQHGFAGASTQAIAERAGLTKSSLHYYIADKESLYAEVLGDLMASWARLFEFEGESDEPAEILAQYIREKLKFTFKNPELSRIFTTELLSGGHRLAQFWPDAIASTNRKVAMIEGWVKQGRIRTLDARLLIMHMWAMTQYYADYAMQAEKMLDTSLRSRKTQEHVLEELVGFVLAGCGIAREHAETPASK